MITGPADDLREGQLQRGPHCGQGEASQKHQAQILGKQINSKWITYTNLKEGMSKGGRGRDCRAPGLHNLESHFHIAAILGGLTLEGNVNHLVTKKTFIPRVFLRLLCLLICFNLSCF